MMLPSLNSTAVARSLRGFCSSVVLGRSLLVAAMSSMAAMPAKGAITTAHQMRRPPDLLVAFGFFATGSNMAARRLRRSLGQDLDERSFQHRASNAGPRRALLRPASFHAYAHVDDAIELLGAHGLFQGERITAAAGEPI